MSAPSSRAPSSVPGAAGLVRLSDDADSDENAAPTKVGPMSKAFVDQMMFKAHLAESSVPPPQSARPAPPPRESHVPVSGAPLPNLKSTARMVGASKLPVLSDEDARLPFEATQRAEAAAFQTPAPAPAVLQPQPFAPARELPMVNVSPWMLAPTPARPTSDNGLAIQVAVCLGTLAAAIAGVVVFLFP